MENETMSIETPSESPITGRMILTDDGGIAFETEQDGEVYRTEHRPDGSMTMVSPSGTWTLTADGTMVTPPRQVP